MKILRIYFILLVALINFQVGNSLYYPQYFQTFIYRGCIDADTSGYVLESNTNLGGVKFQYVRSINVRGIWKLNSTDGFDMTSASNPTGESMCTTFLDINAFYIKSAVMPLPSDLDESTLGLFSSFTMGGSPRIIKDKETEVFDVPMTVGSWGITGTQNYTLFENSDFTGKSYCLAVNESVEKLGWGITYNFGKPDQILFKVGSVRRGCTTSTSSNSKVVHGNGMKGNTVVLDHAGNEVKGRVQTDQNVVNLVHQ